MKYYLGVDVGGTKTHALIADDTGQALGFATGGPGNWEGVGYDGLTRVLLECLRACAATGWDQDRPDCRSRLGYRRLRLAFRAPGSLERHPAARIDLSAGDR